LKTSEYNITIKIPAFLDYLILSPVLLYRRLRYGYSFRLIRLGRGVYTKVDPENYEWLNKYDWHLYIRYRSKYAARMDHKTNMFVHMHRQIMEHMLLTSTTLNSELRTHNCHRHIGDGLVVDHINCDGLDNRRANLRLATRQQNKCNSRPFSHRGTSKYKGVFWAKDRYKWRAAITFKGKTIRLGQFDNEIEAAKARDVAARKYHKEFAWLNFPND